MSKNSDGCLINELINELNGHGFNSYIYIPKGIRIIYIPLYIYIANCKITRD